MQKAQTHTTIYLLILTGICMVFCMSCKKSGAEKPELKSVINTAHLDHLYEEIRMGDDTVGIIHIYAEAPDYHFVDDADEGFACVDDASRAAIFYLLEFQRTDVVEFFRKGRMLIKFILAMQADNGYYYNFVWPDGTIHKDGITSKPEPNFWAWRSLWAMGVARDIISPNDSLYSEILLQQSRLIRNILQEKAFRAETIDTAMGFDVATWLPKVSGTDQASIVLVGLTLDLIHEKEGPYKDSIIDFIHHFAKGIIMMQVHSPGNPEDGAFLSWENLWHAYANIQAYALLSVGQQIKDTAMIAAAKNEIDHFYPSILKEGGLEHFFVKKENNQVTRYDVKQFNQIAYGRRPMIWAALQAYEHSLRKDTQYLRLAEDLAMWFFGSNPAKQNMYDASTGRGYDGIQSPTEINRNAGAESTIESLLSLQQLESMGVYFDQQENAFRDIQ